MADGRTPGGAPPSLEQAQRLQQLGKLEDALQAFLALGAYGPAARVAGKLNRPDQAADLHSRAGEWYRAAVFYRQLREDDKCLAHLLRVPADDPSYRQACVHAVSLAVELGRFDDRLREFVGPFLAGRPAGERELEAFYRAAEGLRLAGALPEARALFEIVAEVEPRYRDVDEILRRLAPAVASAGEAARTRANASASAGAVGAARIPEPARRAEGPAASQGASAGTGTRAYGDPRPSSSSHAGSRASRVAPTQVLPSREPALPAVADEGLDARVDVGEVDVDSYVVEVDPPPPHPAAPVARTKVLPIGAAAGASASSAEPEASFPVPRPVTGTKVLPKDHPAAEPEGNHDREADVPREPASASWLRDGVLVGQRFFLEAKIGEGGMASVYRARDRELGETVAIKFFVPLNEQGLVRFKQELIILRRLNHPNVIRLYEFGNHYDYRYVTMELLEGEDLHQLLARRRLPIEEGLGYLIQACQALQYVHEQGITHRDVKPGNFFITTRGLLKVMDFGIAKRGSTSPLTKTGEIAGTPDYMAPEQFNDFKNVGERTDIYSLGCVAYQLFAHRPPFVHEGLVPMLVAHAHEAPQPPREIDGRIPAALERIILRMLAKAPADRFASCGELVPLLAEIHQSVSGRSR